MFVSVLRFDLLSSVLLLAACSVYAGEPVSEPVSAEAAAPVSAPVSAQAPAAATSRAAPNPLRNLYFGEQHLHTSASPDAFAVGTRSTWADAYKYAMGQEIKLSTTGDPIQKSTPYDFVGITDHAEYFGVMPRLIDDKDPLSKSDFAKKLQDPKGGATDPDSAVSIILHSILTSTAMPEYVHPDLLKTNWERYVKTANEFNKPGEFTALIAFEWTSIPGGRNMHRNVFFRDDVGPAAPFSSFDSIYPEDLWTYQEVQRNEGHENFAIPHNGNVSDGWMYAPNKFLGGPIDARYARRRQLNEPLTEIIQTKGASETNPLLSPNDEFADFELFPNLINVGQPSQVKHGYIRQALTDGLMHEEALGVNPFKFGIVAGADVHSGYSGNEEFNWHGAHGATDDVPKRRLDPKVSPSGEPGAIVGTAGATAIWAEENTRASLFDAMKRKETYGTSGPLIRLRFFGGWDYGEDIVEGEDFVENAYAGGVPMGGDMPARDGKDLARAPTFAIWALKDPESGNLDRIQIVKGWLGGRFNKPQERVYDVALSDDRKADPKTGEVPPVGNTVNIENATYTNDIGDSQLTAVWTDPEFDPTQRAVYYVRVLEIPTPRWSTYDSARSGLPLSPIVPATIQERAWSSPIWYTPPAK